jgi:hypothetical protein
MLITQSSIARLVVIAIVMIIMRLLQFILLYSSSLWLNTRLLLFQAKITLSQLPLKCINFLHQC